MRVEVSQSGEQELAMDKRIIGRCISRLDPDVAMLVSQDGTESSMVNFVEKSHDQIVHKAGLGVESEKLVSSFSLALKFPYVLAAKKNITKRVTKLDKLPSWKLTSPLFSRYF